MTRDEMKKQIAEAVLAAFAARGVVLGERGFFEEQDCCGVVLGERGFFEEQDCCGFLTGKKEKRYKVWNLLGAEEWTEERRGRGLPDAAIDRMAEEVGG